MRTLNVAGWQSGYAAACKAVHSGSIPDSASIYLINKVTYNWRKIMSMPEWWNW